MPQAITERTATTATGAAGATVTLTLPTGTVQGDMLFALFGSTTSGSISTPAGWTVLVGNTSTGTISMWTFCAQYSPGLTLSFPTSGAVTAAILQAYSNADTSLCPTGGGSGFVDIVGAAKGNTTNNTTVSVTSVTAHQGGDHLIDVFVWGNGNSASLNVISGWTIDAQVGNGTTIKVALAHDSATPSFAQGQTGNTLGWTLSATSSNKLSDGTFLSVPQEPFQILPPLPSPILAQ